ncbi:MAG: recombinase family protein, partial [candidate division Zixibacteria bacterium]|nr:recombinase family protein [candidate division Zixibacteria bacterium]
GIKLLMAKNYIDNLSEEVKKGMREKAEQGEYPGKAPFGYRNDTTEKSVVPDEKYAPLVKRLFQLYSTGAYSLVSLRDKVYEEGWRTAKGRKIAKSMVDMVLKNRFYLGEFTWKKTKYRGQHVPLISKNLFDSVQAILTSTPRRQSGRREFLFRGLLKCEHCGCAIVGELKKGKYVYYHCTQARGPCNHPWVREEVLDQHMMDVLKAVEIDDYTVGEIVRALRDSHQDERVFRDAELLRLRKRDGELQSRLDRAYEDRLDGVIDEAYWRRVSASWRDEQDGVAGQIQKLSQTSRGYIDQAVEILELSKMAYSMYLERETDEKRQLLQSLLSNCSSDGVSLCPTYKTPFNLIAEGRQNQLSSPG